MATDCTTFCAIFKILEMDKGVLILVYTGATDDVLTSFDVNVRLLDLVRSTRHISVLY